jgi:hypothetical protein
MKRDIVVEDVEYMPGFKRNLLSYVSLEKKRVWLKYEGDKRYMVCKFGNKLAEVKSEGEVLVLRGELSGALANAVLVHNAIEEQEHVSEAIHEDTLYNWHKRFGHQSYDAIEALAATPSSGIKLIDLERPNCITCAEGKQTKNRQSKKDSGLNSPIDRVGEVICSDFIGPIRQWTESRTVTLSISAITIEAIAVYSLPRRKMKQLRSFCILLATLKDAIIAESKTCALTGAVNMRILTYYVNALA